MQVFEFDDYKSYLLTLIRSRGSAGRGEYRRLSEHLNVHPTLVSQVLSGSKDFSAEQAIKIASYFGLNKSERRYLVILVEIARAGSKDLRDEFIELRNEMKKESLKLKKRLTEQRRMTEAENAVFYSSWIYSAVHLLTTLEKPVSFSFVCERLDLSHEKASMVLNFLRETGLVREENGQLRAGTNSTHLDKGSPYLSKHHANWRIKALEKSESITDEELMYSVNVSVSRKDFAKLREEMVRFIEKFLKTVHGSPAEDLAQLNLDFFWL